MNKTFKLSGEQKINIKFDCEFCYYHDFKKKESKIPKYLYQGVLEKDDYLLKNHFFLR